MFDLRGFRWATAAALAALAIAGLGCRSLGSPLPSTARTERTMLWPKPLEAGDTILFVAPAGPLDRERMARARARLEERGYRVVEQDDLFAEEGFLAGSDERRLAELMSGFLDPEVDAIFPGTGGYGTMRLLDRLDYAAIRAHRKLVIGFSDLTALHAALNRRAGLVTLHSPNPMWGLGSEGEWNAFTAEHFFRAVEGRDRKSGYRVEIPPEAPQPLGLGKGKARGRLVGGNLSLVAALEGTPFAIDARDAILLIEDLREAPYRVDRMLRQLLLAGKLAALRGAILGQFTRNYDREDAPKNEDPRYTVDGVLRQYFEPLGIPVVMNFPIGHHEFNATLPLGGWVEIDADAASVRVLPPAGN